MGSKLAIQLQPDQILAALQRADHPMFPSFLDQLLSLCDAMGAAILEVVPNIEISSPPELWCDMICVPLSPIDASQPIPEVLQGFDDGGWE